MSVYQPWRLFRELPILSNGAQPNDEILSFTSLPYHFPACSIDVVIGEKGSQVLMFLLNLYQTVNNN